MKGTIHMERRVEKTIELHKKGYNCCQAIACTYCDLVGLEAETAFKLTEGFGLGMGSMDGTCGAVSGAIAIIGMVNSTANLDRPDSKTATYQLSKKIPKRFQEKNQSLTCKELKGVETGTPLRTCEGCIKDAAEILEEILEETGIGQ